VKIKTRLKAVVLSLLLIVVYGLMIAIFLVFISYAYIATKGYPTIIRIVAIGIGTGFLLFFNYAGFTRRKRRRQNEKNKTKSKLP
jgi:hypothetical protein